MTRCIRFVLSLGLFATLAASARAENSPRFPALAASPPPRTQEAAAQPERIATLIERIKASGQSFREVQPFHPGLRTENAAPETRETLKQGLLLSVEFGKLQALLKETPNNVVLTIPGLDGVTVQLEMTRVNFLEPGFRVVGSDAIDRSEAVAPGVHYWGVVKGVPGSLAAVSVFRDEVMGIYRTQERGTMVLGRLGGANPLGDHVLYAEKDLTTTNPFACGVTDGAMDFGKDSLDDIGNFAPIATAGRTIRVYFETDYDIYQARQQSAPSVSQLVTGIFSQSAILYQNESVPLTLSELFIWQSPSPYSGVNSSSALLNAFQAQFQPNGTRAPFNGDLGHLLAFRGGGGIAAGFSGLCNADRRQSQCFSGIDNGYSNVPVYSWTVEVVTHEMGHLIGSRHTHACVWNGNNTAIDGCAGYTEENCPLPPNPPASVGGTIMSYCHLTSSGINFNNGFGPQPGAVLRDRFATAGCLGATPPADPTGLAAWFDIQSRTIRLAWVDNSTNEQGFQVQSSFAGGPFFDMTPSTVGANVTTYTGGANPALGSYKFRVRSYAGGTSSNWSAEASLIVSAVVAGYQGCYTDTATRALPVQLGNTTQTIESCKQAAYSAGYKYAGVQYYGYCFAGNTLGYTLVSDRECNTACTANPAQMCGGAWRNSIYATGYAPPVSASIAWIQPAENSWGPAGTLTAAGYATNGSGSVQLVFRERSSSGVWGGWQTVAYQAPVSPDTTWSNTISSGNPTNKCHWFDAYVNYSGVTSPVFHYTGWSGCPVPSTSIAWIQPAENSWGPAGTLTAAGYATNGSGPVQLVFRERSDSGVWGGWQTVAYQAPVSPDTTWSNTISSGNPTNKCHWFDAYTNYSGATSATFHYTGWSGCP